MAADQSGVGQGAVMTPDMPKYKTSDEVDFVVVGSGAAGGIIAKELSQNGFRVVVLEQGPYLTEADFTHNETKILNEDLLTNHPKLQPNTFRKTPSDVAKAQRALVYGRLVGGTSVHFTANFWRLHEIDFVERSKVGAIAGTGFTDWPITYSDLEPYYTKVEWEVGVSGLAGASPFDPPRSKPYPMPPLPTKSSGVLLERAATETGMESVPCANGDFVAAARGPQRLRELRILPGIRLRSWSEVEFAGGDDSCRRENGTLRNSAEFLRASDRGRCEWARDRRSLFRSRAERAFAEGEGRSDFGEWGGNSAIAAAFGEQAISEWAGEFKRARGQIFNAQLRRGFDRSVRGAAQRLQGIRGQPRSFTIFTNWMRRRLASTAVAASMRASISRRSDLPMAHCLQVRRGGARDSKIRWRITSRGRWKSCRTGRRWRSSRTAFRLMPM